MTSVPFQDWIDACSRGEMNINLDKTFKLQEAGEAHEYMEANKVRVRPALVLQCFFPLINFYGFAGVNRIYRLLFQIC